MSDSGALPRRHRRIFRFCLAATLALVAARPLHHASLSLPGWLDRATSQLIHYAILEFGFVVLGGTVIGISMILAVTQA